MTAQQEAVANLHGKVKMRKRLFGFLLYFCYTNY